MLGVEEGRYLYKWDSSRYNNPCGMCKLGLIGAQH